MIPYILVYGYHVGFWSTNIFIDLLWSLFVLFLFFLCVLCLLVGKKYQQNVLVCSLRRTYYVIPKKFKRIFIYIKTQNNTLSENYIISLRLVCFDIFFGPTTDLVFNFIHLIYVFEYFTFILSRKEMLFLFIVVCAGHFYLKLHLILHFISYSLR